MCSGIDHSPTFFQVFLLSDHQGQRAMAPLAMLVGQGYTRESRPLYVAFHIPIYYQYTFYANTL